MNVESDFCGEEEKRLTEELFPLALGQAVAYIQNEDGEFQSKKLSNYLEEYQQQRRKSFEEAKELFIREKNYKSDTNHIREALATWNMTRNKIENNRRYGKQSTDVWDIMAYFAPDKIRIEEIFSKLIADDKEKLWGAVELLDKYKIINLEAGVANIHELVQIIARLKLQKAGKEEEILRRALELINSGSVVNSTSHVTSVWRYASKHGRLIDDFFFNSSYIHREPFFIKENTPLHLLAESGDCKAINAIITRIERHYPSKLREIVNVENNCSQTPLHIAAENGKLNVVECLVSKGANINAKRSGWTPLQVAADNGELGIIKYLLDKGASINTKNKYCGTALHRAAYSGELNVVKYLMNKGANINANAVEPFLNGTPLHFAIYNKKSDIVKYLVSKDADINAKDKYGRTPLHFAVKSGNLDIVKYLIKNGADVNTKIDITGLCYMRLLLMMDNWI